MLIYNYIDLKIIRDNHQDLVSKYNISFNDALNIIFDNKYRYDKNDKEINEL